MPNPFVTPDNTFVRQDIPVFAPNRVVSVTATVAWEPSTGDKVFACSTEQGIKISGGTEGVWPAGQPIGVVSGKTYTFSVTSTIFVM